MGEYYEQKPLHGRSRVRVPTGPQTPVPAARRPTPVPPRDPAGDLSGQLADIRSELQGIHQQLEDSSQGVPIREADAPVGKSSEISGAAKAARKYGTPLIWIATVASGIFSAGIAWTLFVGANATDAEVDSAVEEAMIDHNGGDPEEVGPHPVLVKAIERNTATVKTQAESLDTMAKTVEGLQSTQDRLDSRATYQFEFIRWQADVLECVRKRCKPPGKPQKLRDLESDLMNGP